MQFIGYIIGHTERAILFQDHFWHEPDWMPRSQVDLYFDSESIEVTMQASQWICKQKEISEFQERLPAKTEDKS